MDKFQTTFFLVFISLLMATSFGQVPKPSYARTTLKVSRSLPGETEELKVRTSEGNLATLIVKRKDKSWSLDDPRANQSEQLPRENQATNIERSNERVTWPLGGVSESNASETEKKEESRKLEEAQIERLRAKLSNTEEEKDPSLSFNGTQRGDDNQNEKVTTPRKEDSAISERNVDYGNWRPLVEDGRALRFEESTTEEYRNWKPLPSETTEERTSYGSLLLARNLQDRTQRNLETSGDRKIARYAFLPHQIRSARTNIGANLSINRDSKNVPPEVIVRSEINVKTTPKRTAMSLDRDGTPVIHGQRVPDEPIDKIQTWRNARVINNKLIHESDSASGHSEPTASFYPTEGSADRHKFERFFRNVNRRYGRNMEEEGRNIYLEWDRNAYNNNEALKADVYEPRNDNYRGIVQKRMLHPDSVATYPNSQLYTPQSQKIAPVALKPGARAPVLQYAHPELGVQPAKIVKNELRRPDNFPDNQYSFTEQRQKKKYVLNDKNIVDTYTTKNYYPNQHFYGLKRPSDAPFWVKISENLKNQFSNGVEKVSQFTRPVIDPLVEATHKISQNLGLSKGKEAQDKIGTVTAGSSILIPALGLVASGAALGIGAVAVGRYLDVDVLKRSNEGNDVELEHRRALDAAGPFLRLPDNAPETVYAMENFAEDEAPKGSDYAKSSASNTKNHDGILVIVESDRDAETRENLRKEETTVDPDRRNGDTSGRRRRSLDYLDVFKAEGNPTSLVRNKRLQRKGADSMSEIVEIDLPVREGNIDVTEFLIPGKETGMENPEENENKEDTIVVIEDGSMPLESSRKDRLGTEVSDANTLENVAKIVGGVVAEKIAEKDSARGKIERRKRSVDDDPALEDALQNLENAEIAEVAHVDGDWTNTPCAKRIFCDAMIQRGADAGIFMEKKMAGLLGLIQPGAAVQVSSHFEEVMDAVRRHDCSKFLCPQARPGNVFL